MHLLGGLVDKEKDKITELHRLQIVWVCEKFVSDRRKIKGETVWKGVSEKSKMCQFFKSGFLIEISAESVLVLGEKRVF